MIIQSKKAIKTRKIILYAGLAIIAFYLISIVTQAMNGDKDWIDTFWNFAFFVGFAAFIFLIFPSEHFEFTADELRFRPMADYKRRTVKLAEIDYIYFESDRILLETKAEKKYEIATTNFNPDELQAIKAQLKSLNIRELVEEEESK